MTQPASHRLVDLFGEFIHDANHRVVGVKFICPSCPAIEGAVTLCVLFANPPDGGPPTPSGTTLPGDNEGRRWTRTGDTLESLTLSPSVDCSKCGHWHGFVANGAAP